MGRPHFPADQRKPPPDGGTEKTSITLQSDDIGIGNTKPSVLDCVSIFFPKKNLYSLIKTHDLRPFLTINPTSDSQHGP